MRLLKAAALVAGAGFALLAAAAGLFLARPALFVNERSAAFLARRLGAEYRPSWEGLAVSAESVGRGQHRYGARLTGFCFGDAAGSISACFSELDVSLAVAYSRRGVTLARLERVVARGRTLRLDLSKRRPEAGGFQALSAAGAPSVGYVEVDLPSVEVRGPQGAYEGSLSGRYDPTAAAPFEFRGKARRRGGGALLSVEASGGPERAAGKARYSSPEGLVRRVELDECRYGGAAGPAAACRFALSTAPRGDVRLAPFRSLSGRVRAEGSLRGREYAVRADIVLDPVGTWYRAAARASAEAAGTLGKAPAKVDVALAVDATVARFEDLVVLLRKTPYAVPAPLHVLKGPLSLRVSGRGDPRAGGFLAELRMGADLAGARQRLALAATGQVSVTGLGVGPPQADFDVAVLVKEGVFELPRLDVARLPHGSVDPRISTGAEATDLRDAPASPAGHALGGSVRGRATLKTAKPMTLLSNMAQGPVPVSLDLQGTYPPPAASGKAAFGSFGIELFRRTAVVDHVDVRLPSGGAPGALEGKVVYRTPDAVIDILLSGTPERPLVDFASVPPMKRDEIISLLVFGKAPAQLGPEESASVGSAQAALESRAFGLASLYLFGATPIEHVAYDAGSRNVTVKVRLPGGALLQLGSDFESSRALRLRQPLAPHWAIQSELTEQGPQNRFGTTFLEWFNRY